MRPLPHYGSSGLAHRTPRDASAGYNFVRFLGGAISPFVCGKLGENVSPAAPFWFGAGCVAAGLIVLTTYGARYLRRLNAAH